MKTTNHRPNKRASIAKKASRPAGKKAQTTNRSKVPVSVKAPRKNARSKTGSGNAGGYGPSEPMRIAKAMARAGLCSRRDAERWIEDKRVRVNGSLLTTPAVVVGPKDRIHIDGKPLPSLEPVKLWRYHKPKGMVTTHRDPQDRPTVFDALPAELPRVISIGRLDYNTEGLLLLTNDGALARHLELPATGWLRRYRVRAFGRVTKTELDALSDGITVEGVRYGPITATLDSVQGGNTWLTLGLREGKNREVRKILEHLDLKVNRLIRISYGPFQLLDLAPGGVDSVRRRVVAEQLGETVAKELNLLEDTPARPVRAGGRIGRTGRTAHKQKTAQPRRKAGNGARN